MAIVSTTAASLLFLHFTSQIETSGRKIVALEERRAELLESRAAALRDLADLTSPARLENRAKALGFRPDAAIDTVPVPSLALAAARERRLRDPLAVSGGSVLNMALPQAASPPIGAWAALAGMGGTTASAAGVGAGPDARRVP